MLARRVAVFVLVSFLTACAGSRFDQTIGRPKEEALSSLGPPSQIVQMTNGREIWIYPTGRETTSSSGVDTSPGAASPLVQGISQGIAESIVDSIFDPRGPYRYLYIDANGIVVNWESKSSVRVP